MVKLDPARSQTNEQKRNVVHLTKADYYSSPNLSPVFNLLLDLHRFYLAHLVDTILFVSSWVPYLFSVTEIKSNSSRSMDK